MRKTHPIRSVRTLSAATLLAAIMLVGGCGSDAADNPTSTAGDAAAPEADFQSGRDGTSLSGEASKDGVNPAEQAIGNRSLIYRGDLTVRVKDVEQAATQASAAATTAGGFVGSEKRSSNDSDAQATLVLRVPSKEYQPVFAKLAGLGDELGRNSNTEDVTEAVLDLEIRISAQRASVDSVRKMYASAANLTELVMLEKELSQREAELARLEAKKRNLDDLVALSTITVNLVGPQTVVEEPKDDTPSFLDGLETGWDALVSTVLVVLVILGFLLPFLVPAALLVLIFVLWRRRRRRRQPAAVAPAPPTMSAPTGPSA